MTKAAASLLGAAALVVLTAGAGGKTPRGFLEPLRLLGSEAARFVHTPPPASNGPGLGAEHLVFLDSRVGFAATTGGGGWEPKVGWQQPSEPGRIERTSDGGSTWRTFWQGRGIVFSSIAFVGRRDEVASANDVRDFDPGRGGMPPARPIVFATHDGGRTWTRVRPPFADRLVDVMPVTNRVWVALDRDADSEKPRAVLRRTDDAGSSWGTLTTPPGTETVRFATSSLGFVGAAGSSCPALSQLWRSENGGRTWRPLEGTCGSTYTDIDVVTPRLVFTAESYAPKESDSQMNTIRRSRDGGRTWELIGSAQLQRWPALSHVAFADASHGWAVSHELDQGFTFEALHVTSDGGRTWHARRFPALPTAFRGIRYAWAGDEGVWRTRDGGRAWTVSLRPSRLAAYELELATRATVAVETLGTAWTRNRGRTWSFRPRVPAREAARASRAVAYLDVDDLDSMRAFVTPDHGRTWRRLRPPTRLANFIGDVAFTDPEHGLLAAGQGDFGRVPVFSTSDGGKSWKRVRMPPSVDRNFEANLGPGVIVLPNAVDPPHVNLAALSVDGGSHWQTFPLKADFWDCDAARPSPGTVWVSCSQTVSNGASVHLISHDGGRSWRKIVARAQLDAKVAVVGDQEAWAIGNRYGRSPGTIWHTVDDGRTWRQVWVHVSPRARYFERLTSPRLETG